jgi:BolA protein
MIETIDIQKKLEQEVAPTTLIVEDESWEHTGHAGTNTKAKGTHFRIRIASPRFQGLTRIQQHQIVYKALQAFFTKGLHALAIEVIQ